MNVFEWSMGMLLFVLVIVTGVYFATAAGTNAECKAAGYRHGSVMWNLDRYCETRLDQTDIVVPFEARYTLRRIEEPKYDR